MRRSSLFWGAILILAGTLFLLNNLGILQIDVWGLLWPLFLIALGISFLWGTFFRGETQVEHANVPLEGARRARVRVRHGAGHLQVTSGAMPGDLLEGDFGGGLDLNMRREGDLLDATLSVSTPGFPFAWMPGETLDWSFRLNREIPMALEFETGANETRLDLSDLLISELCLKSGASSTEVTLPAQAGHTRVEVSSGAASLRVTIPMGVAARIQTQGGLSSIRVDTIRFPQAGGVYQSPDYDTATNRIDLKIETGVGSIEVL